MNNSGDRWTEGVCGDGAAILYDGVPVGITDIIRLLNAAEPLILKCVALRDQLRDAENLTEAT